MVMMKSERPLLVNGKVGTEFETTEQHAKDLENSGRATRVIDDDKTAEVRAKSSDKTKQKSDAGATK